jgi:hypothetical protein
MSPAEEIAFLRRRLEDSQTISETRRIALTLIGLSEQDAMEVAQNAGRSLRFAGRQAFTLDFHYMRISLWVESGIVVRALAG